MPKYNPECVWDLPISKLADGHLRESSQVILYLSVFGRRLPSEDEIKSAFLHLTWISHFPICFAATDVDRLYASLRFDWNPEEREKLQLLHEGVDLNYLQPFGWDYDMGGFLILYHSFERSFWAYCSMDYLPYPERLIKLGDKWTDIILDYPSMHFDDLSRAYWRPEFCMKMDPYEIPGLYSHLNLGARPGEGSVL